MDSNNYQQNGAANPQYWDTLQSVAGNLYYMGNQMTQITYGMNELLSRSRAAQERKEVTAYSAASMLTALDNSICIMDKHGRYFPVIEQKFDFALYVEPDEEYNEAPFYVLIADNLPNPVIIPLKDFERTNPLLNALARGTGKSINMYETPSKTAALLQNFFNRNVMVLQVNYYYGWTSKEGSWAYFFPFKITHGKLPVIWPDWKNMTKQFRSPMAQQCPGGDLMHRFAELMRTIKNPRLRAVVMVWGHAASMYSLLCGLGYRLEIGLCFDCHEAIAEGCLRELLAWNDDLIISTREDRKIFLGELVHRKDQPLLISDEPAGQKNAQLLLEIMSSGSVEIPQNKKTYDIQALLTVLCSQPGVLSYASHIAPVEVIRSDFEDDAMEMLARLRKEIPDYIEAFSRYIEGHLDELKTEIRRGMEMAYREAEESVLDQNSVSALGILGGVQQIVADFYEVCTTDQAICRELQELIQTDCVAVLKGGLELASIYDESSTTIAQMVSRELVNSLKSGLFLVQKTTAVSDMGKSEQRPVVYEDNKYLYLTRAALSALAEKVTVSAPSILKALDGCGMLEGAKTNETTRQTRIVTYSSGQRKIVPVYKILKLNLSKPTLFM